MKRIVIFYYDWQNTSGNHAGMAYFARRLKRDLGLPVKLIRVPNGYRNFHRRFQLLWRFIIIRYTTLNLHPEDCFYFMEYLGGRQVGDHRAIALDLRSRGIKNRFIGLVHLPLSALLNLYKKKYITTGLDAIDDIVVFGSSLSDDFRQLGYGSKLRQTFHYTDTDFYRPINKKETNSQFVVIVMGFLYRNREILKEIIERSPDINFELCFGNNKELHSLFSNYKNVEINGFMSERKLIEKMQNSDASLSVMDDTIGSNVITTSLACGLPQVVSDVGSIRDYSSDKNSIFCKTTNDFVIALYALKQNRELCKKMGVDAREKAESISLKKSIDWYRQLFGISHRPLKT